MILYKKLPYYFRVTRRGYHIGWNKLPLSEHKMYVHRLMLRDDEKRVKLDRICRFKPKQTFFNFKKIFPIKTTKIERQPIIVQFPKKLVELMEEDMREKGLISRSEYIREAVRLNLRLEKTKR